MLNSLLLLIFSFGLQETSRVNSPEHLVNQKDRRSDSGVPLSLKKAVLLAMENNVDIEIARFTPLLREEEIGTYEGVFDTNIQSSLAYTDLNHISFGMFGDSLQESTTVKLDTTLSKKIPFGATFSLSYGISDVDTFHQVTSFPSSQGDHWTQSLALAATLPLLKNYGTKYNYSTVILSRNSRDESIYDFENAITSTIYSIHEAYWNLVYAIKDQGVKEQSLAVAEKLREETARKLQAGVVIKLELTQAEAGVATRKEYIIKAKAAVFNAVDRLKLIVNPALLKEKEALLPSDSPAGVSKGFSEENAVDAAFALALQNRPEYLKIMVQLNSQETQLYVSERGLLPSLELTASATLSNPEQESLSDAFNTIADNQTINATLDFNYALGQSASRAAYNSALYTKRSLLLEQKRTENNILVEVREAVRQILTQEKVIEATKKALELAEEQFQAELNRKRRQVSTTFNVLEMQTKVSEAQAREIQARIDYQKALISLKVATGTLLLDMGIKLDEMLIPRTK